MKILWRKEWKRNCSLERFRWQPQSLKAKKIAIERNTLITMYLFHAYTNMAECDNCTSQIIYSASLKSRWTYAVSVSHSNAYFRSMSAHHMKNERIFLPECVYYITVQWTKQCTPFHANIFEKFRRLGEADIWIYSACYFHFFLRLHYCSSIALRL